MNYPVDTTKKYVVHYTSTGEVGPIKDWPRKDGMPVSKQDPDETMLLVVYTDRPDPSADDKRVIKGDWVVDLNAETYTQTWTEEDKPVVVPQQVTPRQLKLALIQDGIYDTVKAIVDAQTVAVQVDWYDASSFERTNATLEALRQHPSINKTPEEVDDLFVLAETL